MQLNDETVRLLIGLEAVGVVLVAGIFAVGIVASLRVYKQMKLAQATAELYKAKAEKAKEELNTFLRRLSEI